MKCLTITALVLFIGLLNHGFAQENPSNAEEVLNKVSDLAGNIPGLNSLNTSALPSIEEAGNLLKQKCDKNGGPEAFENAKRAQTELQQCVENLINSTVLMKEMEEHKPHGELDVVFKKYCRKVPIFKQCISNFTTAVEPCLEPAERENKVIVQNITDALLNFICFKEGDRIALFIAAGGPECFKAKHEVILNKCGNSSLSSYIPVPDMNNGGLPSLENLPNLIFGPKECDIMRSLQTCIVEELETCSDPTPANIVDSIFDFIKRTTPCRNLESAQNAKVVGQRSSAVQLASSVFTVLFLIASLKFA